MAYSHHYSLTVLITELPADLVEDAVSLWRASGLTRPWNDPHADLRRAMSGPSSTVLAATDEHGELQGTVMVGHDGHRGWVYYLAVAGQQRRQGIGRGLMRASEEWLTARAVPKLNLMVRITNKAGLAFYKSLGYEDGKVVVMGRFIGK